MSSIEAPNAGWLYYHDYYRDMNVDYNDKDRLRGILPYAEHVAKKLFRIDPKKFAGSENWFPFLGDQQFTLLTTYPGLLLGTGVAHETGAEEELILGFTFDHTTGLPLVPGSLIKGVLRSAFTAYPKHVLDLIGQITESDEPVNLTALETEIFGVRPGAEPQPGNEDIFYDAVPVFTDCFAARLFGPDHLAPHPGEFTDPIPLPFMKVLPGVAYRFDFSLRDGGFLSANQKVRLFQQLIEDLGVGAKTNVGYGNMITKEEYKRVYLSQEEQERLHREQEEGKRKRKEKEEEERKVKMLAGIPKKSYLRKRPEAGQSVILRGVVQPLSEEERQREADRKNGPRKKVVWAVESEPHDRPWSIQNTRHERFANLRDYKIIKAEVILERIGNDPFKLRVKELPKEFKFLKPVEDKPKNS